MIGGEIPMRLTDADVWQLMKDGFNANEVAYLAGIQPPVAAAWMREAMRKATSRERLKLEAA